MRVSFWEAMSMDKYENRRLCLRSLVDSKGHGAIAAISAASGVDASYVSRMLYEPGRPGGKRIGEALWDKLVSAYPALDEAASKLAVSSVSENENGSGYVRVRQLDAEAGMGNAIENLDNPEVIRSIDFEPGYIRSIIGFAPPPGRLCLIAGRGDSMMPLIQPGDTVVVDTGVTSFDGDGIYLINMGNGHQIKRLLDRGVLHVASDNASYGAPFPIPEGTLIGGKVYLRNRIDRFN